jgi:hypothetical protein
VIHADHRFIPEQTDGSSGKRNALQWRAHSRAFGVAYAGNVLDFDPSLLYSLLYEANDPCSVV